MGEGGGTIRLVVFDMEGVLTADPTVWEIMHRKLGTWESHGLPYWDAYRACEMGYDKFARMDTAVWKGAPLGLLAEAAAEVPLMTGAEELFDFLNRRGVATAIVSNGLTCVANRLAERFGIGYVAANEASNGNGVLTGGLDLRVPYAEKARFLTATRNRLNLPRDAVMAVGDDRADIGMFKVAGVSVAFRAEADEVRAAADHVIDEPDLRHIVPLLD